MFKQDLAAIESLRDGAVHGLFSTYGLKTCDIQYQTFQISEKLLAKPRRVVDEGAETTRC
jgi:hypothetical protein